VKVVTVYRDNDEVNYARPGENLRIRLSGVEEEDISPGFVLSSVSEYSISHLPLASIQLHIFSTLLYVYLHPLPRPDEVSGK
jgi:peptide chain release factor subunit 3